MLMDDRLVALNAVLSHCRELAELYCGERAGVDAEVQATFGRFGATHDRFADQLAGETRAMGELPAEEDPERLGVERLATDIKSFFSSRRDASLASTFDHIESQLSDAIDAAFGHELPERIEQALRQHQQRVAEHRQALAALG